MAIIKELYMYMYYMSSIIIHILIIMFIQVLLGAPVENNFSAAALILKKLLI